MKYLKSYEKIIKGDEYDIDEILPKIEDFLYYVFNDLETNEIDIEFFYEYCGNEYIFNKIEKVDDDYKMYGTHYEDLDNFHKGVFLYQINNRECLENLYEYLGEEFPDYKNAIDMGLL